MADFGPPLQLTQDDLEDLLRRNFEAHWIEGLLADPSSLSLFRGAIAAMLRVQDAVDENFYRGTFILTAPGRARATSVVRLTRPSGAAGTVLAIDRFVDDRGAIWNPIADFLVPLSGGVQTVDVPIQTDRSGYYLNSFEPLTYQIVDALFDPALTVVTPSPQPAVGGRSPFLDQHGIERRTPRTPLESDADYANRMRFLEDAVSPKAMSELVGTVLDGFASTRAAADLIFRWGLRATREPFVDPAQNYQVGLGGTKLAFYDDVQPIPLAGTEPDPGATFIDDVNGHMYREDEDSLAWLDVYLPMLSTVGIAPAIRALADELDRRRGGLVGVRIFFGLDTALLRQPPLGSLTAAGSWTDQVGAVTDAALTAALESYDGDDSYAVSVTGAAAADPVVAGDLRFTLPGPPSPVTISHVRVRARVRRNQVGAAVDPLLRFVIQPTTAGAGERVGPTFTIDFDDYREIALILDENPITAAPWVIADVAGDFVVGVANAAAVGATDQLRVSDLSLEFVVNYT